MTLGVKNKNHARAFFFSHKFPYILNLTNFKFLVIEVFDEMHVANGIAPDVTPLFAASHLRLFCLPMPHKYDVRLIWIN